MARFSVSAAVLALATVIVLPAQASVLFQSVATPNSHGESSSSGGFADMRSAGSTAVGRMSVSSSVTISAIGVLDYLSTAESLKFFVANAATGAILYISGAQSFGADTGGASVQDMSYKVSAPLSFTFNPGTAYAIGSIANGTTYTYADFSQTNAAGPFTSLLSNINVSNFANPSINSYQACCSIGFEVFGASFPVPEPASVALLGVGVVGFVGLRRLMAKGD